MTPHQATCISKRETNITISSDSILKIFHFMADMRKLCPLAVGYDHVVYDAQDPHITIDRTTLNDMFQGIFGYEIFHDMDELQATYNLSFWVNHYNKIELIVDANDDESLSIVVERYEMNISYENSSHSKDVYYIPYDHIPNDLFKLLQ